MNKLNTIHKTLKAAITESDPWDGAAALSFYLILSIFPAIIVGLSIASFIPYENLSTDISRWGMSYIPSALKEIFAQVILDIRSEKNTSLLSISFAVALWTMLSGVAAAIRFINMAYKTKDDRSFIRQRLVSLFVTICLGFVFLSSFFLLLLGKFLTNILSSYLHMPELMSPLVTFIRYGLLEVLLFITLSIIYYFATSLKLKIASVLPGSLFASTTFLLTTYIFAFYLNSYANYSMTYGSIGTAIGLMMWFYIFGFLLIMGAQINQAITPSKKRLISSDF